ncbi:TonB-dependent receptor [Chitinivorax sp. B]|uniref:TonB-dependent receptor plug domain-containing protein n=1 Tax=Chitinivorax sp. B TaxID=2502235 RepID=UPI0010F7B0C8|nr:TonB-dependent receptor [Chitinivorax sp. B]
MKMTRLAYAVASIGLATSVWAADEQPKKTERIEVTGSSIKRVSKEGPAPVETVTKKQIEKTGATTVNELLKSLSTIDIFDQGELASNSPAGSGKASVRMRGMSENQVLVLLNGKRLPRSAIADSSGAGDAVDINMIPVSAIERVEILKDGGSAIYGADAVAGVVNFITKKNYQGGDVGVRFGTSSRHDGTEKGATISGGFGDFDEQRFNVFAALDVFKRDPILRKDREISKSVDFRRFGGPDRRSVSSPYGNKLGPDFQPTGETIKPCPPEMYNDACKYDFNAELLTAYNGADRTSFMSIGSLKITEAIKGSAQIVLAQNKDHFEAHPAPDTFVLPDGTLYAGRFLQGGPRISDRKSTTSQFVLGLDGAVGSIDWSVSASKGRNKVVNQDSNYLDRKRFKAETAAGRIDGTSQTNDPALVESLKVSPRREGTFDLTTLDAKFSGEAFQLPGGALGYAAGVSRWTEKLSDRPDELTTSGSVLGGIQQASADAKRSAYAVFGELALPISKMVELQTALRYDHYPTASKTSPKVAVSIRPTKDLLFRSSYTSSFKMPGLKQLYGAPEQGATDFYGPEQCGALGLPATCEVQGFNVGGANPNLKPEKGKTFNIGVVLDAGPFSGSVDWWAIQQRDAITSPSETEAMLEGQIGTDAQTGRPVVFTPLRNIGQMESRGLDADLSLRFKTALGTVSFRDAVTYYRYIKQRRGNGDFEYLTGVYGTTPTARWRNTFTVGFDASTWSVTTAFRTVSGLNDTSKLPTVANGISPTTRQIASHTEIDLVGSYTGIKGLKLDLGVKNIADRMPPFSITNASSNANTQMGFAELYSSRGRFFYGAVNYKFK